MRSVMLTAELMQELTDDVPGCKLVHENRFQ